MNHTRITPEQIETLAPYEVFVFGSNLAGRHLGGAARYAQQHFGAENGIGSGMTGQCYAAATMDMHLMPLPLWMIHLQIHDFLYYASQNPELTFLVTPIGCGIARFLPEQIAPMFERRSNNVVLPKSFLDILDAKEKRDKATLKSTRRIHKFVGASLGLFFGGLSIPCESWGSLPAILAFGVVGWGIAGLINYQKEHKSCRK